MTLSVQLYSVRDALAADRPGALRRLAGLGYRYVEPFGLGWWKSSMDEVTVAARALRADLDAAGLGVSSVHAWACANSQATVVEACRILGTDTAIVAIPFLVEGFHELDGFGEGIFADREVVTAFARRLNEAGRELARHGIRLGYHNHAFEWRHGLFEEFWELLDPEIVAEVDVYWAKAAGQDPAGVLTGLGERAVAVHLKDGPAVQDAPQTTIGTGDVDVFAALRAGTHLRWHITEIDTTEGDPFELLDANARTLLESGLTSR
ncbi:sugar phosphate isomerase/epimerase family protein [Nonomuraea sp. 10N515B]|uniref:sugar phosphate isomerase/epimerase family protein n=1 Tax=Nonomuraea sp. 10N515B TaxID=3457422 RepID=UPI003FCE004E